MIDGSGRLGQENTNDTDLPPSACRGSPAGTSGRVRGAGGRHCRGPHQKRRQDLRRRPNAGLSAGRSVTVSADEPRHLWWNLVSSSTERIEHWSEGRFPKLPGETEFIPPPKEAPPPHAPNEAPPERRS